VETPNWVSKAYQHLEQIPEHYYNADNTVLLMMQLIQVMINRFMIDRETNHNNAKLSKRFR
jgi:hypothetical protein